MNQITSQKFYGPIGNYSQRPKTLKDLQKEVTSAVKKMQLSRQKNGFVLKGDEEKLVNTLKSLFLTYINEKKEKELVKYLTINNLSSKYVLQALTDLLAKNDTDANNIKRFLMTNKELQKTLSEIASNTSNENSGIADKILKKVNPAKYLPASQTKVVSEDSEGAQKIKATLIKYGSLESDHRKEYGGAKLPPKD